MGELEETEKIDFENKTDMKLDSELSRNKQEEEITRSGSA
jgi:hypothetical protein